MIHELLLGCGHNKKHPYGANTKLTTLDINPDCKPDVLWDLEMPAALPFTDNEFDTIFAFEVLEHTGRQGDWGFFFHQWSDFHRILRPNGLFIGTVPSLKSPWLWGDPSHSRVITKEQFIFLSQKEYENQVGKTAMSDFRFCYKGDFEVVEIVDNDDRLFFKLKAIK